MRAKEHATLGTFIGGVISFTSFVAVEEGKHVTPGPWLAKILKFKPQGIILLPIYVAVGTFVGTCAASLPDLWESAKRLGHIPHP